MTVQKENIDVKQGIGFDFMRMQCTVSHKSLRDTSSSTTVHSYSVKAWHASNLMHPCVGHNNYQIETLTLKLCAQAFCKSYAL